MSANSFASIFHPHKIIELALDAAQPFKNLFMPVGVVNLPPTSHLLQPLSDGERVLIEYVTIVQPPDERRSDGR